MKLKLYYAPIACSFVPLVTLHESGAKFEVQVAFQKMGEESADANAQGLDPRALAAKLEERTLFTMTMKGKR